MCLQSVVREQSSTKAVSIYIQYLSPDLSPKAALIDQFDLIGER